jgi:predicted nucleic acid-binding protein
VSGIKSFLADTNILVYYLEGRPQLKPYIDNNFFISTISEVEFLGVKYIQGISLLKRESLVKDCIILPFDEIVKNIAITVKQQTKIKTPDAIIAGTAIKYQLTLLTADKEFKKVPELNLLLLEI